MTSVFIVAISLGLVGCKSKPDTNTTQGVQSAVPSQSSTANDVPHLKPDLRLLKSHVVLDVRGAKEHAAGHLSGATNIDIDDPEFEKKVSNLDKDKTYVVHCSANVPHGRSERAIQKMRTLGFSRLNQLEGGYAAWVTQALPVEK